VVIQKVGFWVGEGGGVGSGVVRGESLNRPLPIAPLSR
jgi:hypothetical protein